MWTRKFSKVVAVAAISFFFHAGCSVKVDSPQVNAKVEPKIDDVTKYFPKCTAVLPAEANGIFDSGAPVMISVEASSGLAPYSIAGSSDKFGSKTTISRTYTNEGSANLTKEDFVEIRDTLGLPAVCVFTVTIKPVVNPSTLACSIATNLAAPHVNQTFSLAVSATGGTAPYTVSNLNLGVDGVVVTALSGGSATAKYTASGNHTFSATVTDASHSVTCSKTLNVRPAVSVSVVAAPSNSVAANTAITLTASTVGFVGTPTFTFSTLQGGIFITNNGNVASVSSESALPRSTFNVTVTATSNGETASTQVPVTFTAVTPLTCQLTYSPAVYTVDENVVFNLNTQTGESVEFFSFNAGSGATVVSSLSASKTVKFSTGGLRTISAVGKVRRNNTDVFCNASTSITINTALTCNVFTSPNPSYIDDYYAETFDIDAEIPTNSGKGNAKIVSVASTGSYYGLSIWANTGDLSREAYFSEDGTFQVNVTVEDSSGKRATCSTTHVVWYYPFWWY